MKKLYFLLLVTFIGNIQGWAMETTTLDSFVAISYPSPEICTSSNIVSVILNGSGNYLGGTFTASSSGLLLNAVNGTIDPIASAPGNYIVTYTVPFNTLTGEPGISASTIVSIVLQVVPVFDDIVSNCNVQSPPSVSNNGIVGSWIWSQSVVNNSITTTYTFEPNFGQCAVSVMQSVTVIAPFSPVITSESGFSTVYVDQNNAVVATLSLSLDLMPGYTCQWFVDGVLIVGATAGNYTISTALANGNDRVFTVQVTDTATGCSALSTGFVVSQSSGTPPPNGPRIQTLDSGSTLSDLVVSGSGIQWYDSSTNKNSTSTPLPLNTVLVDNTTYYATQTVNDIESLERLPVEVQLTLGIGENELFSLSYWPNPVKNGLIIKALNTIDTAFVINMLGQVLRTTKYNENEIRVDMSSFSSGTYFVRVSSGNKTQVLSIIKE